ncbi:MAG TPA: hypothetical protein VIG38_07185 [Hyphomicrobium sp.]
MRASTSIRSVATAVRVAGWTMATSGAGPLHWWRREQHAWKPRTTESKSPAFEEAAKKHWSVISPVSQGEAL